MLLQYKIPMAILAGSLLCIGYLQFKIVSLERTLAVKETKLTVQKANIETLTQGNLLQQEALEDIRLLNKTHEKRISQLNEEYQLSQGQANEYAAIITSLREQEAIWALQKPYSRGNNATERIASLFLRLTGEDTSDRDTEDKNDSHRP